MSGPADPAAALRALVDPDVRELYVRILRGRPRTMDEIRAIAPRGAALAPALVALEAAGCVRVEPDGLAVAAPDEAVGGVLATVLRSYVERMDEAAALVDSMDAATRAWESSAGRGSALPSRITRGDVGPWWSAVGAGGGDRPSVAVLDLASPERWAQGGDSGGPIPRRLLAPVDRVGDPATRAALARLLDLGVQVRLAATVPAWLYAADGTGALALRWGVGESAGVLTAHDPAVVAALAWLFDSWWSRGLPYPLADATGASLLALLGQGCSDELIAAACAASVRTVQRRISELMERAGARSRFELGARWAVESTGAVN